LARFRVLSKNGRAAASSKTCGAGTGPAAPRWDFGREGAITKTATTASSQTPRRRAQP
jgi:hypothetical protein